MSTRPPDLHEAVPYVLRRSGLRPHRFTGRMIVDAEHHCGDDGHGGATWRIRLALYETQPSGYVAAMQCDNGAQIGASWFDAVPCQSLDQAVSILEQACPDCCDMPPPAEAMNAQRALFYSAQLACRQDALRHEFRAAVGAFLHGLCPQSVA